MKSILLSIKPKWVAKILNGEKTIEIRKKFPKDYKGWVYIYCTKGKPRAILTDKGCIIANKLAVGGNSQYRSGYSLSGEVVARFYCDKVEEIKFDNKEAQRQACLTEDELFDYLFINEPYHEDMHKGYAIHISNLEIFDRPKELDEFRRWFKVFDEVNENTNVLPDYPVTRAPQNMVYIEVEE